MQNVIVTVINPKVRRVHYSHNYDSECMILEGLSNGKEVTYYIAEENEVDHECIGQPKKVLYDRLRKATGGVNIEITKIADRCVICDGEKRNINFKVFRLA